MIENAVHLNIDSSLQQEAERIFVREGLTASDVYCGVLKRIIAEQQVSVDLFLPNAETLAAMRELDEGGGKTFDSVEALMADLNADN